MTLPTLLFRLPPQTRARLHRLSSASAVVLRIVGALLGGYALSAALVALLATLLPLAGVARSEGVTLAAMLGFVIYLLVLLWAFSVRSPWRLWAVLLLGTVAAWGLSRVLTA